MAELTTTTGSGTQSATESPQTSAPASGTASTESGQIQPGTATSLLQSREGIALHPTALPTVNLTASTQASSVAKPVPPRHINGGLLVFSVLLFAVAIVLFWTTGRSVNKTTK